MTDRTPDPDPRPVDAERERAIREEDRARALREEDRARALREEEQARDVRDDGARRGDAEPPAHREPTAPPPTGLSARQEVVQREKAEFGGMKFGSAFFGWLAATGMAVLLTALVAGAGAAVGLGAQPSDAEVADAAPTIGIVGAIAVLAILLIAYYCGGYVAGRMARFSGAKQGVAVWLWAVVTAIIAAIVGAVAGAQWNVLAQLDSFPRLPFGEGEVTTVGIITAVGTLVVSLLGAVLGGISGMRFHRRVDRAGFGD
jgi:membrane protease YdiL (CAAX protease family)